LYDWNAAADAEGEGSEFKTGSGLLAFVFVQVDFTYYVFNYVGIEALGYDLPSG
jgi:hypothetical protein